MFFKKRVARFLREMFRGKPTFIDFFLHFVDICSRRSYAAYTLNVLCYTNSFSRNSWHGGTVRALRMIYQPQNFFWRTIWKNIFLEFVAWIFFFPRIYFPSGLNFSVLPSFCLDLFAASLLSAVFSILRFFLCVAVAVTFQFVRKGIYVLYISTSVV